MTGDGVTPRFEITWLSPADADLDALRRLAAAFGALSPDTLRVVRACRSCGSDRHGKPQVVVPAGARPLHVSLSRTADLAVVVVTDAGPVGVDVEALTSPDQDLTAWVRAEARLKASGHGLTIEPDDLPPSAWSSDLDAPEGHVAAVTILVTTLAAPGA